MKFGFVQDFRNPEPWRRPFPELYAAVLEQTVRAEELGYGHVWLTEHHFTADDSNPSLLPTAAAIATRTSAIRIGTFILLLPFNIRFGWPKTRPVWTSGQTGVLTPASARAIPTWSLTPCVYRARNARHACARALS